jgi:hypothetical protein
MDVQSTWKFSILASGDVGGAEVVMVPVAQQLAHVHGRACSRLSKLEACQFSGACAEALEQHASRAPGLISICLSQRDVGLLQL